MKCHVLIRVVLVIATIIVVIDYQPAMACGSHTKPIEPTESPIKSTKPPKRKHINVVAVLNEY